MRAAIVALALVAAAASLPARAGAPAVPYGDKIAVPDLRGKTFDAAAAIVKKAGFAYDLEQGDCDGGEERGKGLVQCQYPEPGTLADSHILIHVKIQLQAKIIHAEDLEKLRNMKLEDAKKRLKELGYIGKLTVRDEKGDKTCLKGLVCGTNPDTDMQVDEPIVILVGTATVNVDLP